MWTKFQFCTTYTWDHIHASTFNKFSLHFRIVLHNFALLTNFKHLSHT